MMKNLVWPIFILALLTGCEEDDNPIPDPSFVYFKIGEINPYHNDSFILALKDPEDIEQAREMIQDPQKRKIVVAEITKDKSIGYYLNKDLNQNRKWSWHVAEFLEFADNTIEILDGNPTYVEANYDEWVDITKGENGNGRIGFWNYSILSEIAKEELY
jgi:hypothetical protein